MNIIDKQMLPNFIELKGLFTEIYFFLSQSCSQITNFGFQLILIILRSKKLNFTFYEMVTKTVSQTCYMEESYWLGIAFL